MFKSFHYLLIIYRIKDKIEYVRSIPGNEKCCDCNEDNPEWASINLGILLCLNCGGAHRFVRLNYLSIKYYLSLTSNNGGSFNRKKNRFY